MHIYLCLSKFIGAVAWKASDENNIKNTARQQYTSTLLENKGKSKNRKETDGMFYPIPTKKQIYFMESCNWIKLNFKCKLN